MLNEDKIRLMNDIAVFEKKEGKSARPAERYFKNDFIAKHMMQSFFAFTFCYLLVMIIAVLYNMEQIVSTVNVTDVVGMAKKTIVFYLTGLFLFELITWTVYRRKYDEAVRVRKVRIEKLNRLKKRYEFQEKAKELMKEGGRNA